MLSPCDAGLAGRDRSLPGLATLLDAEAFVALVRRAAPASAVRGARIEYVKYKPGVNCLVGYRLDVDGVLRDGYARALRRRMLPSSAEPPFFHPRLAEGVKGREIRREPEALFPDRLSNTLHNHLATQSIPGLLHYEDRNSMAFSVEARVPFADIGRRQAGRAVELQNARLDELSGPAGFARHDLIRRRRGLALGLVGQKTRHRNQRHDEAEADPADDLRLQAHSHALQHGHAFFVRLTETMDG